MKFIDTKGREWKVDIRPSKWPLKKEGHGRGRYQTEIGAILRNRYGRSCVILEEFPCKGEQLTLDFFLPRRKTAIEVQGEQHYSFNSFFHKDRAAFLASKMRDKRKENWCDVNSIKLIKIRWGTPIGDVLKMLP